MIQPNELRKGNLFNPISRRTKIHLPQTSVIFEVVEILLFRVTAVLYGTNPAQVESLPEFRYADLSPIPLTPEILEKCGFVFRNFTYPDGSKADLYSYKIFQITEYYTGEGFGMSWIVASTLSCCNIQLLYLHQLQNLYHALTGQELDTTRINQ